MSAKRCRGYFVASNPLTVGEVFRSSGIYAFFMTLSVCWCLVMATGCVTESVGGIPPAASADERVRAQLDLARAYLEQGDLNRTRVALDKALSIDARSVEAHVLLAVVLQAESEFELAEGHFEKALRIAPRNSQALNNYGAFLYARQRYEDAIVPLRLLVEDTSYRARGQAFENLGFAYLRADKIGAAEEAFLRATQLNVRQPRSTLELAELAFERGDYETALARLLEFRLLAQQNARSLCLAIRVAELRGEADQVASSTMALNNLFPNQADKCQINK